MSNSKIKLRFRAKIILSILPVIIIIFIAVTYKIFVSNEKLIKESTIALASETAKHYSALFEGELNDYITIARSAINTSEVTKRSGDMATEGAKIVGFTVTKKLQPNQHIM